MFLERLGSRHWPGLFEIRSNALREILDLQFRTIVFSMRQRLGERSSRVTHVLDVGAGHAPYREIFPSDVSYLTIDNATPSDYANLSQLPSEARFDVILLIETLEHVRDPAVLLSTLKDKLGQGGELWVSVPFAAREHKAPDDYWRWTSSGLRKVFEANGLRVVKLSVRGNDIASLTARFAVACFRRLENPATAPIAFFLMLVTLPWLIPLAHLSLAFGLGFEDDPLGYFAVCRKED